MARAIVVRILTDRPIKYSLNGFTMSEFDPGEFYQVPPYAAQGMIARGWAEVIDPADVAKKHQQQSDDKEPAEMPALPLKGGDDEAKAKKAR